jgi:hypothetical protein
MKTRTMEKIVIKQVDKETFAVYMGGRYQFTMLSTVSYVKNTFVKQLTYFRFRVEVALLEKA